ncbi:TPA: hypothetical protein JLS34_005032 [Escherichia coli]|nr:hypothetical protein [Escherichia coli]
MRSLSLSLTGRIPPESARLGSLVSSHTLGRVRWDSGTASNLLGQIVPCVHAQSWTH